MNHDNLRVAWLKYVISLCGLILALGPLAHGQDMPNYKVDPFWPKHPLPNKWIIQGVPTMVTDKDDHIWVLNRPRDIMPDESGAAGNPPRTDCCIAAPGRRPRGRRKITSRRTSSREESSSSTWTKPRTKSISSMPSEYSSTAT